MVDVPGVHAWRALQAGILAAMFLCFGLSVAWIAGHPLRTWVETRSWPTAKARIVSLSGSPEEGWEVRYAFEVDGTTYSSEGADTAHTHPSELYWKLADARTAGRTVAVVYDPAAPENAYAERDLTLSTFRDSFFGVPFILAGLVATGLTLMLARRASFRRRRRAQFPNRPWRWEESFDGDVILDESRHRATIAIVAGIIVFVFVEGLVASVAMTRDPDDGVGDLLVPAVIFGVVSLAMIVFGIRGKLGGRLPTLALSGVPVVPGASLRGTLRWFGEAPKTLQVKLIGEKLEVHRFVARSGGAAPGQSSSRRMQREVRAVPVIENPLEISLDRVRRDADANVLELDVPVPPDAPPRQMVELPAFRWRLELRDADGLLAEFQLPVFPAESATVESAA